MDYLEILEMFSWVPGIPVLAVVGFLLLILIFYLSWLPIGGCWEALVDIGFCYDDCIIYSFYGMPWVWCIPPVKPLLLFAVVPIRLLYLSVF